ncbi:MAG: hypothetical protein WC852_06565 [Candidatus Nanoarchaeia archaeon]|jgi:hypothetical protein
MDIKSGQIITNFSEIESLVNESFAEMNVSHEEITYKPMILDEQNFYNASKAFLPKLYHAPVSEEIYSKLQGFKVSGISKRYQYLFFIKKGPFEDVYSIFMHEFSHGLNEGVVKKFDNAQMIGCAVSEIMAYSFQYWSCEVLQKLHPEYDVNPLLALAGHSLAVEDNPELRKTEHGIAALALFEIYKQMPYPKSFERVYKKLRTSLSGLEKIEVISA